MALEAEIEEGAGSPAKKINKKLIGAAAALVLLLAVGAGAYFFLFAGESQEGAHDAAASESFIFNLPQMTINLSSEDETESFMRLSVAVEVADEAMMEEIQPHLAKVIDSFQVYLRELRKSDLEGSAGIYRLKEELLRRVNVAIYPAVIKSVLFKEILVQ